MILHAEERKTPVAHAFVGVIVEVDVRNFDVACGQGFWVDAEAVILRRDLYLIG